MEMQYFKDYSPILGREMECKVWGHAGKPVLFIPCQDGRFFDFENFDMLNVWRPWIDAGKVMVFSIDTLDKETWSDKDNDPGWRIWRYEQWIQYICQEMVPFMQDMAAERNGTFGREGVLVFGCSLGATHAANLYYRRPDLFDRLMALSGMYVPEYGFGDFVNDLVYDNTPLFFLENMAEDHPYMELYNSQKSVLCVGQGPWEIPDSTHRMQDVLLRKGIHTWVDFWGYDCAHDWDWWYKQVVYFLPYLLDE